MSKRAYFGIMSDSLGHEQEFGVVCENKLMQLVSHFSQKIPNLQVTKLGDDGSTALSFTQPNGTVQYLSFYRAPEFDSELECDC